MNRDRQAPSSPAPDPEGPKSADDADDVLFGTFHDEADGQSSDAHDGLELDAQQSAEVRGIFLTTLPQYLEPVEQMLELLFSAEGATDETRDALASAVASLRTAASRIGVTDVLGCLERISDDLVDLQDASGPPPSALQERLRRDLADVRRVASGASPESSAPAAAPSTTIFSALQGATGLGDAVLERLTAAGLLTVEQLRMARPDEVAAVTGLELATVRALLVATGVAMAPAPESPKDVTPPPPELPGIDEPLAQVLRAQVEAETSYDELFAEVQREKGRLQERARQLAAAESANTELAEELPKLEVELQRKLAKIEELERKRSELEQQKVAQDAAVVELERRMAELHRVEQKTTARREWLESTVAQLEDQLARLLGRSLR